MDAVKVIEIKKSIFAENEKDAEELRKELKDRGVYLLNLMSSPGSGKTTTLIRTINLLKDKLRIAVMEADIDSDVDAVKIKEATGIESIQLHTGGMCHLDAEMTRQGLDGLRLQDYDLVVLENVGNLVCPAEFDTGSCRNAMILSVPEGDDKPLKYPLRRRRHQQDGCPSVFRFRYGEVPGEHPHAQSACSGHPYLRPYRRRR